MNQWILRLVLVTGAAISCTTCAPAQSMISISSEPHHHLQMHNDHVNVYHAQLLPHEAMLMHKHEFDYLQVAIGDAQLVRILPDQPEASRSVRDGQVDFGLAGATHSSRNDSDSTYNTIAVELLRPQGQVQNGCVAAAAGKPLNCVAGDPPHGQLQFETNSTRVYRTAISPHQTMNLASASEDELIIVLDDTKIKEDDHAAKVLHPGDFEWIEKGSAAHEINNATEKSIRIVEILLQP
jgi:hypothetical protein